MVIQASSLVHRFISDLEFVKDVFAIGDSPAAMQAILDRITFRAATVDLSFNRHKMKAISTFPIGQVRHNF